MSGFIFDRIRYFLRIHKAGSAGSIMNFNFDRFRTKLIAIFVLISSIPLIIFAAVIYRKESQLVRNKALSHLDTIIAQNVLMIEGFRSERIRDLNLLAATMRDLGSETALNHFRLMQREYKLYKHFFVISAEGSVLFETGNLKILRKNLLDQEWFKSSKKGIPFMGVINLSELKKHDLLVTVPLASLNGRGMALLGATIDFQGIEHVMKDTSIGSTGEVYLINKDGVFLTTTRAGEGRAGDSMAPEIFTHYFTPAGSDEHVDYRGKKVVRVYKKIPGLDWFIIGEQDSEEIFSDIETLRKIFIGFVLLLIALIILTGYIISKRIANLLKSAYHQNKELEIQLIQKDKLASMGLLTAGIAHELNTPFASALLYTQMLKEDMKNSSPSYTEKLSFIEEEIKRGSRIIRSLLDFSKQSQTDSFITDVNEVLYKLLNISERFCFDRKINVKQSLEEGIPLVKGNASILYQVFMNIITNAVEAMDNGGTLTVVTRYIQALQKVTVEIQDTGPGIPEEYLGDIFDPFFTTKSLAEGTGLGLAISYSMVRKMGGNIRVTSFCQKKNDSPSLPTGTTFTIELVVQKNGYENNRE